MIEVITIEKDTVLNLLHDLSKLFQEKEAEHLEVSLKLSKLPRQEEARACSRGASAAYLEAQKAVQHTIREILII